MKKLLIGLLTLGGLSIFAQEALEIGDKAIHVGTLGNVRVKIISIRADGNYVARYKSIKDGDTIYRNVPREQLALMSGCSIDLCVGDKAIHLETLGNVKVKIIAIRVDGNYVAKYRSIKGEDKTYRNVLRRELGKL